MLRIPSITLGLLVATTVGQAESPALHVAPNGRTFVDAAGKPFFWLGDTAWMLFQATDRDEGEFYLETRARQGFTVIQAALMMGEERVCGTLAPNRYGDVAIIGDAAHPNTTPGTRADYPAEYDYWDHADFIIEAAAKRGLVLALLPNFVGSRGDGYKYLNPSTAEAYGKFLGERYKTKNIVWVMGGDHIPKDPAHLTTWNLLAKAITRAATGTEDYGRTTMTFHSGHSSSESWHDAPWLDFNMLQTWDKHTEIPNRVEAD
ncbi:MAG: DUF4038 domain-containing protein [Opitutaceae bacterium]|nr:DUF4038 domain-containing protein [Opitutaceae bacterium]